MTFMNSLQPISFIKVITFMLWFLVSIGTPVFSKYFSPSFIPLEEKCEFSVCNDLCVKKGFPRVSFYQPVPAMSHLCIDMDCYCSTQSDNIEFAWTRGRAISNYDCELPLPAEGDKSEIDDCVTMCNGFEYNLNDIDPSDNTIPDTELVFNLVVNDDCCCGARPNFSETLIELPDEEGSGSDYDYLQTPDQELDKSEEDGGSYAQEQQEVDEDPTKWYPGKDEYVEEDKKRKHNPWRESSGEASKRLKQGEVEAPDNSE